MGSPAKKIKKIIPKEIRPAIPALAAVFGPAALAGTSFGVASGFASLPVGIQSALINAATQAATEGKIDPKQAALAGATAQLGAAAKAKFPGTGVTSGAIDPGVPSGGSYDTIFSANQKLANVIPDKVFSDATIAKVAAAPKPTLLETIGTKVGQTLAPVDYSASNGILSTLAAGAKAATPTATYAAAEKVKELNEKALRDYEAQLRSQGITDSATRRNQIFGYFSRAGYADDEINSMLDKYGYAFGGRVGFKEGGGIQALIDYLKEKEDEDEDFNLGKFSTGLEGIKSGYEIATGQPLMGMKPQPTRFGLADGGLMNLREGGMPAEMDMRGGGFVPIGKQRRADDVPARLSKDEFVLTARAVDGVGKATTGNAKDGAKIMYDFMNKYEALA
jgi:hypothetical protein